MVSILLAGLAVYTALSMVVLSSLRPLDPTGEADKRSLTAFAFLYGGLPGLLRLIASCLSLAASLAESVADYTELVAGRLTALSARRVAKRKKKAHRA